MMNGHGSYDKRSPTTITVHDDGAQDEKESFDTDADVPNRLYRGVERPAAQAARKLSPTVDEIKTVDWTRGVRGVILSSMFLMTCVSSLIFCMNFVHVRMPRNLPPLPDLGHELFPKMEPESLGDTSMKMMVGIMLVCMATNKNRWPLIIRFMLTVGTMYLLRIPTIWWTSLPPTENHCRYHFQEIEDIYANTWLGIRSLGGLNNHCGDLMYSGHTCMSSTIWITIFTYYRHRPLIRLIISLLMFFTAIFLVGTRSHYTIDVWVAWLITVLVHKLTPEYFPYTPKQVIQMIKDI